MMILKAKVPGLLWKQDEEKSQQATNKIQWNINEVGLLRLNCTSVNGEADICNE